MRIYFMTTKRPKAIAKKLKKAAEASGIELKLSHAQRAVARMYGYAHWHELNSSLGRSAPSPMDAEVTGEEVMARRAYQANVLENELAVESELAIALVDAVLPTDRLGRHTLEWDDGGQEDDIQPDRARYW